MNRFVKFLGILPLLLTGCSAEDAVSTDIAPSDDVVSDITVSISDFKGTTRTLIDPKDNYSMKWTAGDVIGITPQNGRQIAFPLEGGAESNSAVFSGNGWALKPNTSYIAYYPLVNDAYFDQNDMYLNYNQWQGRNNDLSDVLRYDYLISDFVEPVNGSLKFQLNHIGCLVHVTVYDAPGQPYNNFALKTADQSSIFYLSAKMDLTTGTVSPHEFNLSNNFEMGLGSIVPSSGKLDLFFMLYPVDATGHDLTITIDNLNFSIPGRNFEKGTYQHIEYFNELPGTLLPGLKHENWDDNY